jgi:RNA polymerase sigma-70 factor (ECF subfamily)
MRRALVDEQAMDRNTAFPHVLQDLRSGDDNAATVVHARFVRRLVTLAHRRCHAWAKAKADRDCEDLVQSAFKSFFVRCGRGQFDLDSWEEAWRLLVVITLRKCGMRHEYLRAGRRDAAREVESGLESADRRPTPDQAAMLAEIVDQWLLEMEPLDREIVELGLQGCSSEQIAQRLKRSERTVRRVRRHVEDRLKALIVGVA